jgi:outer membrane protein assembly factor BamB
MNPAARSHGMGPKSTPVVADGRIFTFGINGALSSFDAATGELIWQKKTAVSPLYGTAMSPLVEDGVLIAHVGGPGRGALTAYAADTGDIQWRWSGDGPGYASPIIVEISGTRQIVTQSEEHIVGIDLASGQLLWSIPFETAYVQNIVTPVIHDGNLIFSGLDKGIFAVKVTKNSSDWKTEKVWENNDLSMYMSSPVMMDDSLFGLSHRRRGQFFCLDARNGKAHWVSEGRQGENASLILAGKALTLLTTNAELIIAEAHEKSFNIIRRYRVAESPTWAHHVIAGNGVLVKDKSTLALWTLE